MGRFFEPFLLEELPAKDVFAQQAYRAQQVKSEKLEGMESKSIIGEKSLAFAKRIAKCYRFLTEKKHEGIMSKQLLRCGTMRTSWW